jgi:hypothetical protein
MGYASARDPEFLGTLRSWLASQPEILVLIRYSYAAGSKEFELISSYAEATERLALLPPRTCVIAFREPQLPIRGEVTEQFVEECLGRVTEGTEFLVLEAEATQHGSRSWRHWDAGTSHAELRDVLISSFGRSVAVGLYPPWLEDNDNVISAVVPDENGVVVTGIY